MRAEPHQTEFSRAAESCGVVGGVFRCGGAQDGVLPRFLLWWVCSIGFREGECCESSESGCLRGVDGGWRDEVHLSVTDADCPVLSVDVVVTSGAQHDSVVQV